MADVDLTENRQGELRATSIAITLLAVFFVVLRFISRRMKGIGVGADDIMTINQMHLPVNKQVMIHLSTKDVIHSFGIPEMRIKQDAIPGMTIPFFFTPTMTSDEFLEKIKGTSREGKGFEIACAQLCGNAHYRMRGYVTIDTEVQYNAWLNVQAEYLQEEEDDDDW